MIILGNLCLGLAAFIFILPLQLVLRHLDTRQNQDGEYVWAAIFVLIPFWLLLAVAACAAVSRGELDWCFRARGGQYALALITCAAMLVITLLSFIGRSEPVDQMPAVMRFFTGWAAFIIPLVALGFWVMTLNHGLHESINPLIYRVPMIAVTAPSLLAGLILLGGVFVQLQKRQSARIEQEVARASERDQNIIDRINTLNADDGFVELIGFSNRFEDEKIRALALAKLHAYPGFNKDLTTILQNGWAEKGMVYLDACEVPDKKPFAEPVRVAIQKLTEKTREDAASSYQLYADQFDWNTRLIMSVADKFSDQGVDYLPAIREFRAALDLPKLQTVGGNARQSLDAWLAKHAKASPR